MKYSWLILSLAISAPALSARPTPTPGKSETTLLGTCVDQKTGQALSIEHFSNTNNRDARDNNEGVTVSSDDENTRTLFISTNDGAFNFVNNAEYLKVSHMDLLMVGTSLRASINIDKVSGRGKINYRRKLCGFNGCKTTISNHNLVNCRMK